MQELVKTYEVNDHDNIITFLNGVTTLESIDERVLKHGVYLHRHNEIIGMVSYEIFDQVGMIRYFIYNQTVTAELIINLFFRLYYEAKEAGIRQLVSVATTNHAKHLFEMLGFIKTTNTGLTDSLNVSNKDVSVMVIDLASSIVYED